MHRAVDPGVALQRVRWLAELANALGQAQELACRLPVAQGAGEEEKDLYARLDAVRAEVDALRFGDWVDPRKEMEPAWLERLLPDVVALALPGT